MSNRINGPRNSGQTGAAVFPKPEIMEYLRYRAVQEGGRTRQRAFILLSTSNTRRATNKGVNSYFPQDSHGAEKCRRCFRKFEPSCKLDNLTILTLGSLAQTWFSDKLLQVDCCSTQPKWRSTCQKRHHHEAIMFHSFEAAIDNRCYSSFITQFHVIQGSV